MTLPITIEEYDPRWPQEFESICTRVAEGLGPLAAAIEHVGSTSVPALAAKPIIDLDILLRSPADLSEVIRILESFGYEHRGDLGVPGREAFRAPAGSFPHHLYVCPPDGREYYRHLAFRDHLRAHPQDAETYAALKRRLALKHADDREAYSCGKADFVEEILRRAGAEHFPHGDRIIP